MTGLAGWRDWPIFYGGMAGLAILFGGMAGYNFWRDAGFVTFLAGWRDTDIEEMRTVLIIQRTADDYRKSMQH